MSQGLISKTADTESKIGEYPMLIHCIFRDDKNQKLLTVMMKRQKACLIGVYWHGFYYYLRLQMESVSDPVVIRSETETVSVFEYWVERREGEERLECVVQLHLSDINE